MYIITGILLGLSTLLFIGPVLFYLLKSSMETGFKAGLAVAFGIIAGDIICVYLSLYGSRFIVDSSTNQQWLAFIGGTLLLIIGLKYVIKPDLEIQKKESVSKKSLLLYFSNGFLINFVNPFVFAVWFGFVSYNQSLYTKFETALSLSLTLAVILSSDILKAYYSNKVLRLINPKRLKTIFKIFGLIMILFSIRLFYFAFA